MTETQQRTGMTMTQLAQKAGVDISTLRKYIRLGLVPPPRKIHPTLSLYENDMVPVLIQQIQDVRQRMIHKDQAGIKTIAGNKERVSVKPIIVNKKSASPPNWGAERVPEKSVSMRKMADALGMPRNRLHSLVAKGVIPPPTKASATLSVYPRTDIPKLQKIVEAYDKSKKNQPSVQAPGKTGYVTLRSLILEEGVSESQMYYLVDSNKIPPPDLTRPLRYSEDRAAEIKRILREIHDTRKPVSSNNTLKQYREIKAENARIREELEELRNTLASIEEILTPRQRKFFRFGRR